MISVKEICDKIEALISKVRIPLPPIPAVLIACSAIKRPGLSALFMASKIMRRLSSEAGGYIGNLPDGTKNIMDALILITCETIVDAIKNDMKVETVISPGSIVVGPEGVNVGFIKSDGIAR